MQAGALLVLFFAWNVSQTFKELETKQSIMIHHVHSGTPTFISITGAYVLMIMHSIFSVMAGLIFKMLFMLFSVYNTA